MIVHEGKRFINRTQQLKVVIDLEPTLFQIFFPLIVLKKHLRKYIHRFKICTGYIYSKQKLTMKKH